MIGKIIKGKDMSEEMINLVTTITGGYSAEESYFVVKSRSGLMIYDIDES